MLTAYKSNDRSDSDHARTSSPAPAQTGTTTPSTDDHGNEEITGTAGGYGFRYTRPAHELGGDDGCEDAGKIIMMAQDEIQSSTVDLLQMSISTVCEGRKSEKRFKTEIDNFVAIPTILKEHLALCTGCPPLYNLQR